MKARRGLLVGWLFCAGCSEVSIYTPQLAAPGELVLRAHQGFELYAEGKLVAQSPSYRGLAEYVRCVPQAQAEARAATRAGRGARALQITGLILTGVSLGGLAGVFRDDLTPLWIAGSLLTGAGYALMATGGWLLPRAHGHAIDALNYYNDAVGSRGGTCTNPQPDLPQLPPAAP